MRRTWSAQRARLVAGARAGPAVAHRPEVGPDLVGRDFSRTRAGGRGDLRRWLLPALAGAVLAALLLASLRTSILRVRYDLATAMTEEAALLERRRAVAVELRELRDPARLHRMARELGLARPERVIDLGRPERRR